ncbi:MAG TPA: winged helix-turn-helix domain-containing protein [Solirubrobacteraceae bacterium]
MLTAGAATTVSARIHADLRAAILSGALAPGDPLPGERRLAEEHGANRHAVREALKRLQEAGLIQIAHGGATRVLDWRRHGGLGLLLDLAREGEAPPALGIARATMEMRAAIGADAARRAAERATESERRAIAARAAAIGDVAAYDAFWDAIVDASANVAYRLALTTLVAGQQVLDLGPETVGAELADAGAIGRLAAAIADGRADAAAAHARDLLERSIPVGT